MTPPQQFNAEFIERRLREHRDWQERQAGELEAAIVSEVYVAVVLAIDAQESECDFDA